METIVLYNIGILITVLCDKRMPTSHSQYVYVYICIYIYIPDLTISFLQ